MAENARLSGSVLPPDVAQGWSPPKPQPVGFGDVPSRKSEDGPTIPANRPRVIPEQFVPRADYHTAVQLARWQGAFLGAIVMALLEVLATVLT